MAETFTARMDRERPPAGIARRRTYRILIGTAEVARGTARERLWSAIQRQLTARYAPDAGLLGISRDDGGSNYASAGIYTVMTRSAGTFTVLVKDAPERFCLTS